MTKATTLAMPYLIQRIIDSVQMKNATRFQESVCLSVVAMLAFMLFVIGVLFTELYRNGNFNPFEKADDVEDFKIKKIESAIHNAW